MDTLTNDQPVDDAALFADVTGNAPAAPADPVEAIPAAPVVPAAPAAPDPMVPSGRLREESDARRTAERERDELRAELAAARAPKPAAAQPKPEIDPWADPKGLARNEANEVVGPVQEQFRAFVFQTSRDNALRDHGAEKITAAENALEAAIRGGQVDGATVKANLARSLNPVGDVLRWHSRQSTLSTVGADPEKWFEEQLAKRFADPAQRTKYLDQLQKPQAAPGAAPLTEVPPKSNASVPPSLRNVGTSAAAQVANSDQPSDAELFASVTARGRR